jgi:hypothetical protein
MGSDIVDTGSNVLSGLNHQREQIQNSRMQVVLLLAMCLNFISPTIDLICFSNSWGALIQNWEKQNLL